MLQEYSKLERYETETGNTEIDQWECLIRKVDYVSMLLKSVLKNRPDVHIYATVTNHTKTLADIDKRISIQGNQVQRQNITVKECYQLQQVYKGDPNEIVSLSVENVAFPLPSYKTDEKKAKHPVGRAGTLGT